MASIPGLKFITRLIKAFAGSKENISSAEEGISNKMMQDQSVNNAKKSSNLSKDLTPETTLKPKINLQEIREGRVKLKPTAQDNQKDPIETKTTPHIPLSDLLREALAQRNPDQQQKKLQRPSTPPPAPPVTNMENIPLKPKINLQEIREGRAKLKPIAKDNQKGSIETKTTPHIPLSDLLREALAQRNPDQQQKKLQRPLAPPTAPPVTNTENTPLKHQVNLQEIRDGRAKLKPTAQDNQKGPIETKTTPHIPLSDLLREALAQRNPDQQQKKLQRPLAPPPAPPVTNTENTAIKPKLQRPSTPPPAPPVTNTENIPLKPKINLQEIREGRAKLKPIAKDNQKGPIETPTAVISKPDVVKKLLNEIRSIGKELKNIDVPLQIPKQDATTKKHRSNIDVNDEKSATSGQKFTDEIAQQSKGSMDKGR